MPQHTIHVRTTRKQLMDTIRQELPRALSGHGPDSTGLVQGLQLRVGMQALSLIKEAFVVKARGGTDEAGDSWPPLTRKHIAYGRRHPGLDSIRRQAKAEGRPGRPLLTKRQNERWKALYTRALRGLAAQNREGGAGPEEKGHAAAYAWMVLKTEGGKTILGEYGDTPTEILRDSGQLLNSLSPGVAGPSGHPNQIFRVNPGEVIIGTNRKGAARMHAGKRRLWPRVETWPQRWWGLLSGTLRDGAANVLQRMLGG